MNAKRLKRAHCGEPARLRPLLDFVVRSRGSVDPKRFPNEEFELFSIPAYDSGHPDELRGEQIGSSKIFVEPDDVLISKIVPHIQRVWIVPKKNGKRQIASGEWIVFRGDEIAPEFLRQILFTKQFHEQFMHTVAGMGGSLLRARPSGVARIEIPVPDSIEEQRRIAVILDMADGIRRKRKQALALADALFKSVFLAIFGDPVSNPKGMREIALGEIADITSGLTKGRKTNPNEVLRSLPYMRVANVQDGYLDLSEIKEIDATEAEINKYRLRRGDILLTEGGDPDKLGRGCVWRDEISECIHQNHIFRVRVLDDAILPEILSRQIASRRGKDYFLRAAKQTTGIATINKRQLSDYPVLVPSSVQQSEFTKLSTPIEGLIQKLTDELQQAERFFASLSQRAFSGDL